MLGNWLVAFLGGWVGASPPGYPAAFRFALPPKEKHMELSAVLTPAPEGGYVAFNPETGTTTQGETVEEALLNLREATELYLEEFPLSIVGRPLLTSFQVPKHA